MRFDRLHSSSEQNDFEPCGADTISLNLKCLLTDIEDVVKPPVTETSILGDLNNYNLDELPKEPIDNQDPLQRRSQFELQEYQQFQRDPIQPTDTSESELEQLDKHFHTMAGDNGTRSYASNYKTTNIDKVQLPDKIKCVTCKRVKGHHSFAEKRRKDFKEAIAAGHAKATSTTEYIPCSMCTGQQVTELECYVCDKVYGLDKFSRAQRKNPDRATCWKCMQAQLNTEPGDSDDDDSISGDSDNDSDDSDGTYGTGTTTMGGTFSNLSITNGGSSTPGGVALSSANGTSTTGGVALRSPTTSLPPQLRKGPSSVISTTSSASNNTVTTGASGFAKVKATPVKFECAAARRVREFDAQQEESVTVADSSDEED